MLWYSAVAVILPLSASYAAVLNIYNKWMCGYTWVFPHLPVYNRPHCYCCFVIVAHCGIGAAFPPSPSQRFFCKGLIKSWACICPARKLSFSCKKSLSNWLLARIRCLNKNLVIMANLIPSAVELAVIMDNLIQSAVAKVTKMCNLVPSTVAKVIKQQTVLCLTHQPSTIYSLVWFCSRVNIFRAQ